VPRIPRGSPGPPGSKVPSVFRAAIPESEIFTDGDRSFPCGKTNGRPALSCDGKTYIWFGLALYKRPTDAIGEGGGIYTAQSTGPGTGAGEGEEGVNHFRRNHECEFIELGGVLVN